jgi:hypothetical protein
MQMSLHASEGDLDALGLSRKYQILFFRLGDLKPELEWFGFAQKTYSV